MIAVALPHDGVGPVGGEDEVCAAHLFRVYDLALEAETHAQGPAPVCQDLEERLPRQAGEAVPGGRERGAAVVDLDVVPAVARRRHGGDGLPIPVRQGLLGGVREDDAEAEGVVEAVPLVDLDLVARVELLEEDREEEAGGSAPDAHDPHDSPSCVIWPAMTRCWISVVPS